MPAAKFEIKRKCEECGATFIAKTLESHYCSKECIQKAYNRRKAEKKKREQMDVIISLIPEGRDYISVSEAEAMFGISGKTIRRMIKNGKVPAINIGERLTRVSKSALLEMVPLREEPIDRSKPLPKFYSLEPEDCYTILLPVFRQSLTFVEYNFKTRKEADKARALALVLACTRQDFLLWSPQR